MTIAEITLLPPLFPPIGLKRTIMAAEAPITATTTAISVTWKGRVYSYPRGLVVCVSEVGSEPAGRVAFREELEAAVKRGDLPPDLMTEEKQRAALALCKTCDDPLMGDALIQYQLDWPGVRIKTCQCDPVDVNKLSIGHMRQPPKPEEPMPTKRKRRSRAKVKP